jgi:hypothetical protein
MPLDLRETPRGHGDPLDAPSPPAKPVADNVKIRKDLRAAPPGLWQALDLILEAAAFAQSLDREIADLAMLPALAIGERVGIPDDVVYRMRESAFAEARRTRDGGPRRPARARGKGR